MIAIAFAALFALVIYLWIRLRWLIDRTRLLERRLLEIQLLEMDNTLTETLQHLLTHIETTDAD